MFCCVVKVDDDMFVQVNLLIHRLDNQTKSDRDIVNIEKKKKYFLLKILDAWI